MAGGAQYAIQQGWGVSALILQHFIEQSTRNDLDVGQQGDVLDLTGTVASQKIGRIEGPHILDKIAGIVSKYASSLGICCDSNTIKRVKIGGWYGVVYELKDNPDLYWGIHGANIQWSAILDVGPAKSSNFCCTVQYKIVSIDATLHDRFDFNPGQFRTSRKIS